VTGRLVLVAGRAGVADALAEGLAARGHTVHRDGLVDPGRMAVGAAVDRAVARLGGLDLVVHVHHSDPSPTPVADLPAAAWVDGCEDEMARAFHLVQAAHAPLVASAGRLVAVVPTFAMAGAAGFAAAAASAEAIRVLVKGVAKQWGVHGVTANCLAVDAGLVLPGPIGREVSAGVALAEPALGSSGDAVADLAPLLDTLTGPDAHFLTGATLIADGGVWMVAP
jgi:NAD(P)-dependent dehydrogenase (short-subunit alcohol dehydrogenase family)